MLRCNIFTAEILLKKHCEYRGYVKLELVNLKVD